MKNFFQVYELEGSWTIEEHRLVIIPAQASLDPFGMCFKVGNFIPQMVSRKGRELRPLECGEG